MRFMLNKLKDERWLIKKSEGCWMLIKICGITTVEMARAVEAAGAEMVGFVFAESSRKVTPEKARDIASALSPTTQTVGVFVNEAPAEMERIAGLVGLDFFQLHGEEAPDVARRLSRPVIKAFSIDKVSDETLATYPARYFLIDSPGTTYRGGSGEAFDWRRLTGREFDRDRFILAGGLHAENVQAAIRQARPSGVDVSSGVETEGQKDAGKIVKFVRAVRALS